MGRDTVVHYVCKVVSTLCYIQLVDTFAFIVLQLETSGYEAQTIDPRVNHLLTSEEPTAYKFHVYLTQDTGGSLSLSLKVILKNHKVQ